MYNEQPVTWANWADRKPGEGECMSCPAGKFSYTTGSTSSEKFCLFCPKGTYSTVVAADTCSTCIMCPSASMAVREGASSAAQCVTCEAGKYGVFDSAGAGCAVCAKGKYAAAGAVACAACAPGLSASSGAASCSSCPAGKILDFTNTGTRSILNLKMISKSFDPLNPAVTATLEISDSTGTAYPFSNDWVKRGFNVAWFNGKDAGLNTTKSFDTYFSEDESDSMLAFLKMIPAGDVASMFVFDDAKNSLKAEVTTYLALNFGAKLVGNLAFRSSYALVGMKGGPALAEEIALVGTSGVTLEASFTATTSCEACAAGKFEAAGKCENCDTGKVALATGATKCMSCPGGSEYQDSTTCVKCAGGEFSTTGAECTACVAGLFNQVGTETRKHLVATSKGFDVGAGVSLNSKVFLKDGDSAFDEAVYDAAWASRGFNVVTFNNQGGAVKSNVTFDTYASATESAAMLAHLTHNVAVGEVVTFTVYDEGSRFLGDDVKAYMAAEFKATKVGSLSFRDAYALIAVKGQEEPMSSFAESLAASSAAAGARADALAVFVDGGTSFGFSSCWAPSADNSVKSTQDTLVRCAAGEYSVGGAAAATCDKCPVGKFALTRSPDQNKFEIAVSVPKLSTELPTIDIKMNDGAGGAPSAIPPLEFNNTWVKQGFNVVEMDIDSLKISWSNFDTSASKAESDRLLAYLQAEPVALRKVYLFFTHLDASANLGEDTKAYISEFFDGAKVVALGMNDAYALVSSKLSKKTSKPPITVSFESYSPGSSTQPASVDTGVQTVSNTYAAECTNCAAGLFGSTEGLTAATCTGGGCAAGQFSAEGSKECTACAAGKFSGAKAGECVTCTVDANLNAGGGEDAAEKAKKNCQLCPPGFKAPGSAGVKKSVKVVATSTTADSGNVSMLTVDGLKASAANLRRGFNIFILDKVTGLAKMYKNFDTSGFSSESDAMLVWMKGLTTTADDVFVFLVFEEASLNLGLDTKAYLASNFGAALVSNLAPRAGYALISKKAVGTQSLAEVTSAVNTKGPSAEITAWEIDDKCAACDAGKYSPGGRAYVGSVTSTLAVCNVCTAGKYSAAEAAECAECEAGETSIAPFTACASCGVGKIASAGSGLCVGCLKGQYAPKAAASELISLMASSKGFQMGDSAFKVAVLDITTTGVQMFPRDFDNSWVDRGFNVVQINSATGAADSARNFDTYDKKKTASADMLAHLMAMPAGAIVAMFVNDEGSNALGADLKTYVATTFGATKLNSLGFRDTYALISVKGGAALKEATAKADSAAGVTVETFVRMVSKVDACKKCSAGRFQAAANEGECDECAAGQFAKEEGLEACVNCEAGKYQAAKGMAACIECAAGKWADAGAPSAICTACGAGMFLATAGGTQAGQCSNCAAGMYNALTGAAACKLCAPGKTSAASGQSCDLCTAGKSNKVYGGACEVCAKGYYQALTGQTKCNYCGDNQTTAGTGSIAASACTPARRRLRSLA